MKLKVMLLGFVLSILLHPIYADVSNDIYEEVHQDIPSNDLDRQADSDENTYEDSENLYLEDGDEEEEELDDDQDFEDEDADLNSDDEGEEEDDDEY